MPPDTPPETGLDKLATAAAKTHRRTRHTPTPKNGPSPATDTPGATGPAGMAVPGPDGPADTPNRMITGAGAGERGTVATQPDQQPTPDEVIADASASTSSEDHPNTGATMDHGNRDTAPGQHQPPDQDGLEHGNPPAIPPPTGAPAPMRRRALIPASAETVPEVGMPDSVRKALRLSLINQLRAVNAAHRLVETRQADLVQAFTEAHEQGFPHTEIERIRSEAVGLGFHDTDYTHLLYLTGWLP